MSLTFREITSGNSNSNGSEMESQVTAIASAMLQCQVGALCIDERTSNTELTWFDFQGLDGTKFALAFRNMDCPKNNSQEIGCKVRQHLRLTKLIKGSVRTEVFAIESEPRSESTEVHTFSILPRIERGELKFEDYRRIYVRGALPQLQNESASTDLTKRYEPESLTLRWALQLSQSALEAILDGNSDHCLSDQQARFLVCDTDQSFELKVGDRSDPRKIEFLISEKVNMSDLEHQLAVTVSLGEIAIPAKVVSEIRPGSSITLDRPAVLEAVLKVGEHAWAETEVEIGEGEITLRVKNLIAI